MEKLSAAVVQTKVRTPIGLLLVLASLAKTILDAFEKGRVILEHLPPIIAFLAKPFPSIALFLIGIGLILWELEGIRKASGDPQRRHLRHYLIGSGFTFLGLVIIIITVSGAGVLFSRYVGAKPESKKTGSMPATLPSTTSGGAAVSESKPTEIKAHKNRKAQAPPKQQTVTVSNSASQDAAVEGASTQGVQGGDSMHTAATKTVTPCPTGGTAIRTEDQVSFNNLNIDEGPCDVGIDAKKGSKGSQFDNTKIRINHETPSPESDKSVRPTSTDKPNVPHDEARKHICLEGVRIINYGNNGTGLKVFPGGQKDCVYDNVTFVSDEKKLKGEEQQRVGINIGKGIGVNVEMQGNTLINSGIHLASPVNATDTTVMLQSSEMAKQISKLYRRGRDLADNCGRFRMSSLWPSDVSDKNQLDQLAFGWDAVVAALLATDTQHNSLKAWAAIFPDHVTQCDQVGDRNMFLLTRILPLFS
jgi:hypothetical protein